MKNYVLSCLALLPLILTPNAGAALIHVPADQPTIQQAIDAAATGDTVLVAPGTYFENIDYHGKEVIVKSQRGASETIIDGNNAGPVITFQSAEGSGAMLIGFTIQHGSALFGAGITIGGGFPRRLSVEMFSVTTPREWGDSERLSAVTSAPQPLMATSSSATPAILNSIPGSSPLSTVLRL